MLEHYRELSGKPGFVIQEQGDFDAAATDATADPDDELFLLGERCARAYLEADALHYRAMTLLAEFHHREGWRDTGFTSTAEWLDRLLLVPALGNLVDGLELATLPPLTMPLPAGGQYRQGHGGDQVVQTGVTQLVEKGTICVEEKAFVNDGRWR